MIRVEGDCATAPASKPPLRVIFCRTAGFDFGRNTFNCGHDRLLIWPRQRRYGRYLLLGFCVDRLRQFVDCSGCARPCPESEISTSAKASRTHVPTTADSFTAQVSFLKVHRRSVVVLRRPSAGYGGRNYRHGKNIQGIEASARSRAGHRQCRVDRMEGPITIVRCEVDGGGITCASKPSG